MTHHLTPAAETSTWLVKGMTCGHCAGAVTEELTSVDGVSKVDVDLVPNGISTVTVTSDGSLTRDQVEKALDDAGDYALA